MGKSKRKLEEVSKRLESLQYLIDSIRIKANEILDLADDEEANDRYIKYDNEEVETDDPEAACDGSCCTPETRGNCPCQTCL